MRTIELHIFKYSELSDKAKEKARDRYREALAGDNFFAEYVIEDFHETLKALGFDPYKRVSSRATGYNAKLRSTVQWSGFWSQGDGAAFEGRWRAENFNPKELLANRPVDALSNDATNANAELHRIAAEILACKKAGLLNATIRAARGFFMALDDAQAFDPNDPEDSRDADTGLRVRFIDAARDLASGFYKALESEYKYWNSDEQIAETIEANEYEFYADGRQAHD